jgi:hypothetical protein
VSIELILTSTDECAPSKFGMEGCTPYRDKQLFAAPGVVLTLLEREFPGEVVLRLSERDARPEGEQADPDHSEVQDVGPAPPVSPESTEVV